MLGLGLLHMDSGDTGQPITEGHSLQLSGVQPRGAECCPCWWVRGRARLEPHPIHLGKVLPSGPLGGRSPPVTLSLLHLTRRAPHFPQLLPLAQPHLGGLGQLCLLSLAGEPWTTFRKWSWDSWVWGPALGPGPWVLLSLGEQESCGQGGLWRPCQQGAGRASCWK